jgi:signal peptidase II
MTMIRTAPLGSRLLRFGLGFAGLTIVLDQLNKWWLLAVYGLKEQDRIALMPFLDVVYVKNLGISYGLGAGHLSQPVLALFSFVAAAALLVWLVRGSDNRLMAASIGLIAGGAVGNGIDRMYLGGVADFYSLHAFGYSWYVFNIADVAIVAGVAGLLYDVVRPSRKGAAKAP